MPDTVDLAADYQQVHQIGTGWWSGPYRYLLITTGPAEVCSQWHEMDEEAIVVVIRGELRLEQRRCDHIETVPVPESSRATVPAGSAFRITGSDALFELYVPFEPGQDRDG